MHGIGPQRTAEITAQQPFLAASVTAPPALHSLLQLISDLYFLVHCVLQPPDRVTTVGACARVPAMMIVRVVRFRLMHDASALIAIARVPARVPKLVSLAHGLSHIIHCRIFNPGDA